MSLPTHEDLMLPILRRAAAAGSEVIVPSLLPDLAEPNRYGPWASGKTQHRLTKNEAALLKAGIPHLPQMLDPEPAPEPRRRRKSDEGRVG